MVFPVHRYLHIIDAGKYYRISIMWSMLYLIFMQTLISVYEEASKDHILQQHDGLCGTYGSLFSRR